MPIINHHSNKPSHLKIVASLTLPTSHLLALDVCLRDAFS
ncbi:DUF645 family protein [Vibrio mimicus]